MTPKKASRRSTACSVGVLDAIFNIPPVTRSNSNGSQNSPQHQISVRCKGRDGSPVDEKVTHFSNREDDSASLGVTASSGRSRAESLFSKIRSTSSASTKSVKKPHHSNVKTSKRQTQHREQSYESSNDSIVSVAPEETKRTASKLKRKPVEQETSPKDSTALNSLAPQPQSQPKKVHPLLYHSSAYPVGIQSIQQPQVAAPNKASVVPPLRQFPVPPYQPTVVPWVLPAQSTSYAEQLQHVQQKINETTARLHQNPANEQLKGEIDALQRQLNTIMNTAVTGSSKKETTPTLNPAQERKLTAKSAPCTDKKDDVSLEAGSNEGLSVRHHLCSNCHKVRSVKYHRLHPLQYDRAPVHNLCEGCKDLKPDFLAQFHFCSGCGVVRSKAFHRKVYEGTSTDEPNYCGKCIARVSKAKRLAESTVINQDINTLTNESLASVTGKPDDEQHCEDRSRSARYSLMAISGEDASESNSSKNSSLTNEVKTSTSKAASVLVDKDEPPVPISAYYPARVHSSNHRRAQRSQPKMAPESSGSIKNSPAYRAPYVQDDVSEPLSPCSIVSSRQQVKPSSPLDGNDTISRSGSNSSPRTASPTEPCASSADRFTDKQSDTTPKYWNGAFSRRHETTMFVNTDINYPLDCEAPISSCRKPFHDIDESCEQTRYSRGAFKDRSPLDSTGLSWIASASGYQSPPHSPPWNTSSDYMGTTTFNSNNPYEDSRQPAYKRPQTSMFSNFNKASRSADDFYRKPSPTPSQFSSCTSPFWRCRWRNPCDHNPQPIIEEPISPPSSPIQSPMRLEFNVSNSSDSE